jgi:putative ABC transport system permease protein
MRALDQKILRDLWHLRGQVMAISMVIAAGVAVLVMALSTQQALVQTAEAYYERYAFGDVFAGLKRAPEHIARRIAAIEGVQTVQTRVAHFATLDIEGFPEPVMAQFVSIPEYRQPVLNQLALRAGRLVAANRPDEVVLNEPFAEAHGFLPGDEIVAILNGHRRKLQIVGTALSPEFIYSLGPGALMPDDLRFGVLWMGSEALAAAFDLQGSFNNVSLRLARGVNAETVIPQLDQLLERYGGVGAIARADQLSNWFVMNEVVQLGTMSRILPAIFLLVSAFLTNMVLARLIATERSQIGLMKAFGYSNFEVGWHYTKLVIAIGAMGMALGLLVGAWVGRMNTEMYAHLFRFPLLLYRPSASAFIIAGGLSLSAAVVGAVGSVRRAALLPPAQAMIPPSPPVYKSSRLARTRCSHWLDQPTRIILRHIAREPMRSLLSGGGIACSVGLLVMALQWSDALDYLAQRYFFDAQRQHLMVGLAESQASNIVHEFEHMPGVLTVEPMRIVSADFQSGAVTHRGVLTGVQSQARLQPIFDDYRNVIVPMPAAGLVLATRLARKLNVGIGDRIWVNIREGRRPQVQLPVVDLFETHIGMPAFLHVAALNRLLKERPSVDYVNLLIDPARESALYLALKKLPKVSAVMLRRAAIDSFDATVTGNMMVFITLFAVFAGVLGFGVAYNAARISLSERGRDLATLRVLGFTRGETFYILVGELMLLMVLALPLGCWFGSGLTRLMATSFDTELFRIPLIVEPSTYGVAVLIAIVSTLLSAVIVRRRVDRLNLINVLKTRE